MNQAIVVGSINMDIVAYVQRHPNIGETVFGNSLQYFPGGKGANQAVACKRLGAETRMIGRLGDDGFGRQLLDFLQQQGVDTSEVRCLEQTSTGTAIISVADDGSNHIVVISGANNCWENDCCADLTIDAGDIVLAQFEIPDPVILSAFNKAKAAGATTLLNPAPVRNIAPAIAQLTDLLVVNEHELAALSGQTVAAADDEASIRQAGDWLLRDGYAGLIVTLGEHGVRLWHDGQFRRIAVQKVSAIDSTGAGDTFIGGLTAGLLSGMDLYQAAEYGNLAAAISVTRPGAAASIPNRSELEQFAR